ncbi:hypothetical protein K0U27_11305 [archaeon]|nr:hypothetical protein [archaeon]
MKARLLILLFFSAFTIPLVYAEESNTFEVDGYDIITNSPNVSAMDIDWDSEHLPKLSVNFIEQYTGQFQIQIPKNMPRTMNLDFETTLMMDVSSLSGTDQEKDWNEHITEKDFKMIDDRVSETESLCHYIITVELSKVDYFKIVTGSVASGRWEPVTIQNKECDNVSDETPFQNESVFPHHGYAVSKIPPLKQIKSGIALIDVKCNEGKSPAYKYNRMSVACVSEETLVELWDRGWATMRFYTGEDTSSHALCNNYEGKWHPEYNGCGGDISDLQCSLMGGKFVDNLKICHNDICPKNKTYTLCVTNSNDPEPEPPSTSTQCKPGLPPFHSDFYLDKELCKWKLIPEPIPNEVIPYVWNNHLQKKQIDFSPKDRSYFNFGEGFDPENENRVCSSIILTDKTELYISSTFTIEPFEIIDTVTSEAQPADCYKIWKTETLLVEPSPELGAWLKNYWEKENED